MSELNTNTEFSPTEEKELLSESKKFRFDRLLYLLFLIPVAAILIRVFFGSFIVVSGSSMEPTLQSGGLIFGTFVRDNTEIKVGDIIVFKQDEKNLVKRVAGVPGDTIQENEQFPLGRKLDNNEYYVLGDNTDNSRDSREFGPITRDEIKYKYSGIYIKQPLVWVVLVLGFIIVGIKIRNEVTYAKQQNKPQN